MLTSILMDGDTAYWCERPDMFAAIADGKTPEERSLLVLKWFIVSVATGGYRRASDLNFSLQGTLKGQYTSRNEKMGSEKKSGIPSMTCFI